ncbi:DUF4376 domain-containing protein [Variovorax sp. OV700]|uniref:DUF4376 domain-containing protein n=1 Tax=Variovorax sp. OV700 TaxID=1882826 RepID=UPI000886054D|nr:DUF4376 domain-containing protein [Variovorax sp. OV700]SDI78036.1 protein of unknown function [Variovorax sp. OV700]
MKQFALMHEGRVLEVIDDIVLVDGNLVPLADRYHPDLVRQLLPYDPANPPLPPAAAAQTLAQLQEALTAAATAHRWKMETGGIVLPSGVRIATDRGGQDRITSVIVNAEHAGIEPIDFKAESGWESLTRSELRVIATAMAQHIQACFSAERRHHEAIAALQTLAAAQNYDLSNGWPQQSLAGLPEA